MSRYSCCSTVLFERFAQLSGHSPYDFILAEIFQRASFDLISVTCHYFGHSSDKLHKVYDPRDRLESVTATDIVFAYQQQSKTAGHGYVTVMLVCLILH